MKSNYLGSEQHKANATNSFKLAREKQQQMKEQRIAEYNSAPNVCQHCMLALDYEHKNKKYCSRSCANTANNIGRTKSKETKDKISTIMKDKDYSSRKGILRGGRNVCLVKPVNCKVCQKLFYVRAHSEQVCCSIECRNYARVKIRPYQNGSRKTQWYFNKHVNQEVLLESSWEVEIAELLDSLDIEWIRPDPIPWFDAEGKKHLYFPDFYLCKYDVYLDPKNPYCMALDEYKLKEASKQIKLIYGTRLLIRDYIQGLK